MDLKPLAVASCCVFALSFTACREAPKEEEPWQRNVLVARVQLPDTGPRSMMELSRLLERADAVPGAAAAAADILPGVVLYRQRGMLVITNEGGLPLDLKDGVFRVISPEYFKVMNIRLLRGRDFSVVDNAGSPAVAIVGESYAKRAWPSQDPIGKRMMLHSVGPRATVVGVVQDGPGDQGKLELYIPFTQCASYGQDIQRLPWFMLARTKGDPKAVAPALSRAVGQEFQDLGTWLKKP
jgi:hypothetical protein